MKKNIFTLILVLTAFFVQAQSNVVTVYGFRQQSTGGMQKRGDIDEKGRLTKVSPKPVFKYSIYLASKVKERLYPVQMWINGKPFSVKAEPFENNPVVPTNSDAPVTKLKTLLPETAGPALKLTAIPLTVDKSNGRAKALALQNAVVVLYKQAGKFQYGVLKKFTDLEPIALQ